MATNPTPMNDDHVEEFMHYVRIAQEFFKAHEIEASDTIVGHLAVTLCKAADTYKLPDHHNKYGEAWWADENIDKWQCEYSAREPL
jgi:hypothetical protein